MHFRSFEPIDVPESGLQPPGTTTTYTRIPSGRVVLCITSDLPLSDRTIWTDTESRQIRSQLSALIFGMVRVAENRQIEFDTQERERLKREEEERIQLEARRKREAEEKWRADLWQDIERWNKSEQIRRFAAAVEARIQWSTSKVRPEHLDWLDWMSDYADRMDPLWERMNSPPAGGEPH